MGGVIISELGTSGYMEEKEDDIHKRKTTFKTNAFKQFSKSILSNNNHFNNLSLRSFPLLKVDLP